MMTDEELRNMRKLQADYGRAVATIEEQARRLRELETANRILTGREPTPCPHCQSETVDRQPMHGSRRQMRTSADADRARRAYQPIVHG